MKQQDLHKEIQTIDSEINSPVSFLAQSPLYSITELNAIRFFALNLLQAKMNRIVKKENKDHVYKNSFNTKLRNTPY